MHTFVKVLEIGAIVLGLGVLAVFGFLIAFLSDPNTYR